MERNTVSQKRFISSLLINFINLFSEKQTHERWCNSGSHNTHPILNNVVNGFCFINKLSYSES